MPREGTSLVKGVAAADVCGKHGGAVEAGCQGGESRRLRREGEEMPAGVETAVQIKDYICGASVLQQPQPHAL